MYVNTGGSANTPALTTSAGHYLKRRIEQKLVTEKLTIAVNTEPTTATRNAKTSPVTSPVMQKEKLRPKPDVILFVGYDLTRSPERLSFWFILPQDYAATGVYQRPVDKEQLRIEWRSPH